MGGTRVRDRVRGFGGRGGRDARDGGGAAGGEGGPRWGGRGGRRGRGGPAGRAAANRGARGGSERWRAVRRRAESPRRRVSCSSRPPTELADGFGPEAPYAPASPTQA